MSAEIPIIADWEKKGLKWQYLRGVNMHPFILRAGQQLQLPRDPHTFTYPEGVICHFSAGFDHPSCGIRMEYAPNFDTEENFTISNLIMGITRPEPLIYAIAPPDSFPGLYGLRIPSFWKWEQFLRLYIINTDSLPHKVIASNYILAVLTEKRPKERLDELEDLERLRMIYEMYPEHREMLKKKLEPSVLEFLSEKVK